MFVFNSGFCVVVQLVFADLLVFLVDCAACAVILWILCYVNVD